MTILTALFNIGTARGPRPLIAGVLAVAIGTLITRGVLHALSDAVS